MTAAAPEPALVEHDGWRVRFATKADNQALCDLFRAVHVPGALDIAQERDPDYFALLDLHAGAHDTAVGVADDGRLVASGTIVTRPGWFGDEPITTGYLCDLRVAEGFREGKMVVRAYGKVMDEVRERRGAEIFTTVIFDSNERAKRALTGGGQGRRKDQPIYRPMTPFEMVSVQLTRPKRAPSARVRAATDRDADALFGFLAERERRRLLGWRVDPDGIAARLAAWPGCSLEDFFIAREGGRIVGCLAPWDTRAVKRTRVLGYHQHMRWVKLLFNAGATLGRFQKLPPAGDCFDFSFLTHLEIVDDDPAVLHDLLLAAYPGLRARGQHFMSAFVPRGSRLAEAFGGFSIQKTAMTLYAVHPQDSRFAKRDVKTLWPGFEMALS
ncbi:MAG: hypothetical protein H6719_06820 [Sandaracinaceae bacterium]|nr:hypothetical protein [Sandaracinaceae bacterium]